MALLVFLCTVLPGTILADMIPVSIAVQYGLEIIPDIGAGSSVYALLGPTDGPLWTTPENEALMGNLFSLITTLGGDSTQIALLFQPGAIFADLTIYEQSPDASILTVAPIVDALAGDSVSDISSDVPEPATMGLPGGVILLVSYYAIRRLRKIDLHHGPLQRSD